MGEARLQVKVSADAKEASAAFSALAKDIKAVGTESVGVTDGVARVDAAMQKLARAPDTAAGLGRAIAKSRVEIEDLRAELEKTPASAEKLKSIQSALAGADAALQAATVRMGRLKDAAGDTAKAAGNLGDKFDAAKGAAGGLSGAFESMRSTGTGATATIGALGVGVSVAATAIMGAVAQGKELGRMIDEWDAKRAKSDKVTADAAVKAALLDQANRAVTRGLIEQGKTTDETIKRYVEMTLKMGKLTEQGRDYIAGLAQMKAPRAWAEIEAQAKAMVITLEGAYKRSEEEGNRWALENAAGLKAIIAEYDRVGKVVPESLVKSLDAAQKWAEANGKAAASARAVGEAAAAAVGGVDLLKSALEGIGKTGTAESIEAVAQALKLISLSGGDVGTAVRGNVDDLMKLRTAAEGSYETLDAFRKGIMDQLPAYQATEIAGQKYAGSIEAIAKSTEEYEAARRAANEADIAAGIEMAALEARAMSTSYAIDTIGESWAKATGHAAGFTVEVRHATKAVEETDPGFTAFIESLASVSDEYERMVPYVGALIADLEAGRIAPEEFGKAIDAMRVSFMQIQGVSGQMFGDIDSLFNRLRELVNSFTYGESDAGQREKKRRGK